MLRQLWFIER